MGIEHHREVLQWGRAVIQVARTLLGAEPGAEPMPGVDGRALFRLETGAPSRAASSTAAARI
jgi:hypothetical protein